MADEEHIRQEQQRLAALTPKDLELTRLPSGIGGRALVFGIRHMLTLLRIGLPFLLALAALYFVITPHLVDVTFGYDPANALLRDESPHAILAIELIEMAVFATAGAVYAVAIHRWIVLDTMPASGLYFRFTTAELKFGTLTALLFLSYDFLTVIGPMLLRSRIAQQLLPTFEFLDFIPEAFWPWALAFLLIIIVLLLPRFSLIFPHIAVTGKLSPALSWTAMRGKLVSWVITFLVVNMAMGILLAGIDLAVSVLNAKALSRWISVENGSEFSQELEIAITALRDTLYLAWFGIAEAVNIAALSYIYQAAVRSRFAPAQQSGET